MILTPTAFLGPVCHANGVFVVDALPSEVEFFNGDANGSAAGTARVLFDPRDSSLSLNPNGDVAFSSSPIEPQDFGDCNHNPANGCVETVTYICFRPQGTMAFGATNPSFNCNSEHELNKRRSDLRAIPPAYVFVSWQAFSSLKAQPQWRYPLKALGSAHQWR